MDLPHKTQRAMSRLAPDAFGTPRALIAGVAGNFRMRILVLAAVTSTVAAVGCVISDPNALDALPFYSESPALVREAGVAMVDAAPDATHEALDAAVEASHDASTDAAHEASTDASTDAAHEARTDASTDGGATTRDAADGAPADASADGPG